MTVNKFEDFMAKVDAALRSICGLTSQDLPDYDYMGAWKDGEDPEEVAEAAYDVR